MRKLAVFLLSFMLIFNSVYAEDVAEAAHATNEPEVEEKATPVPEKPSETEEPKKKEEQAAQETVAPKTDPTPKPEATATPTVAPTSTPDTTQLPDPTKTPDPTKEPEPTPSSEPTKEPVAEFKTIQVGSRQKETFTSEKQEFSWKLEIGSQKNLYLVTSGAVKITIKKDNGSKIHAYEAKKEGSKYQPIDVKLDLGKGKYVIVAERVGTKNGEFAWIVLQREEPTEAPKQTEVEKEKAAEKPAEATESEKPKVIETPVPEQTPVPTEIPASATASMQEEEVENVAEPEPEPEQITPVGESSEEISSQQAQEESIPGTVSSEEETLLSDSAEQSEGSLLNNSVQPDQEEESDGSDKEDKENISDEMREISDQVSDQELGIGDDLLVTSDDAQERIYFSPEDDLDLAENREGDRSEDVSDESAGSTESDGKAEVPSDPTDGTDEAVQNISQSDNDLPSEAQDKDDILAEVEESGDPTSEEDTEDTVSPPLEESDSSSRDALREESDADDEQIAPVLDNDLSKEENLGESVPEEESVAQESTENNALEEAPDSLLAEQSDEPTEDADEESKENLDPEENNTDPKEDSVDELNGEDDGEAQESNEATDSADEGEAADDGMEGETIEEGDGDPLSREEPHVTITSYYEGTLHFGTEIILTAHAAPSDNVRYQWQYSPDGGETVITIEGATESVYSYVLTPENQNYVWRVMVTKVQAEEL